MTAHTPGMTTPAEEAADVVDRVQVSATLRHLNHVIVRDFTRTIETPAQWHAVDLLQKRLATELRRLGDDAWERDVAERGLARRVAETPGDWAAQLVAALGLVEAHTGPSPASRTAIDAYLVDGRTPERAAHGVTVLLEGCLGVTNVGARLELLVELDGIFTQ